MYCITEQQIDFILNDISARGIELVSLQQDLLDHVCCIVEQSLEENGDFEHFYFTTIERFYKTELKEIEIETKHLLDNKNYYTMKKIMIGSGFFSAGILCLGLLFKFMHWPGAAVLIFTAILLVSFVFLPLLFTLKIKEKQNNNGKWILGIGILCAILISIGILFKIMHWPMANMLSMSALLLLLFVFIPIYFFSGFKNPVTKVNTMVSSLLMVIGCGLIMSLIRSPEGSKVEAKFQKDYLIRNEQILAKEAQQKQFFFTTSAESNDMKIYTICEELKSFLIEKETGKRTISINSNQKNKMIGENWANSYLTSSESTLKQLDILHELIQEYNERCKDENSKLPSNILQITEKEHVKEVLDAFFQIQMMVLQNQE